MLAGGCRGFFAALLFWATQLLALVVLIVPAVLFHHPLIILLAPAAVCAFCACVLLACRIFARSCCRPPPVHTSPENLLPVVSPNSLLKRSSSISSSLAAHEFCLWVVDVATLQRELKKSSAHAVLTDLHSPSMHLLRRVQHVPDLDVALISYRQALAKNRRDGFTLDDAALQSIVEVAAKAGIRSLWLDAWCHKVADAYDHVAFCSTLSNVVRHARMVIWLPRARTTAQPSYQFRLWCSFEAAVIAARGLPVVIAGVGPTRSQRLLRSLGIRSLAVPLCVPTTAEVCDT